MSVNSGGLRPLCNAMDWIACDGAVAARYPRSLLVHGPHVSRTAIMSVISCGLHLLCDVMAVDSV